MRPFRFAVIATGLVCLCSLLLCGCGGGAKDPNKLGSQYDKLFTSADPETKACWDTATAAMKTNGYAVAIQAMRSLAMQGKATPEQGKAAQETGKAISDKMYAEANKGNAAALQALDELRKATGR